MRAASKPTRSRQARTAIAARSSARTSASAPPARPTGVRTAETIRASSTSVLRFYGGGRIGVARAPFDRRFAASRRRCCRNTDAAPHCGRHLAPERLTCGVYVISREQSARLRCPAQASARLIVRTRIDEECSSRVADGSASRLCTGYSLAESCDRCRCATSSQCWCRCFVPLAVPMLQRRRPPRRRRPLQSAPATMSELNSALPDCGQQVLFVPGRPQRKRNRQHHPRIADRTWHHRRHDG